MGSCWSKWVRAGEEKGAAVVREGKNDMRSTDGERGGRHGEGGAGQLRGLLQASSEPYQNSLRRWSAQDVWLHYGPNHNTKCTKNPTCSQQHTLKPQILTLLTKTQIIKEDQRESCLSPQQEVEIANFNNSRIGFYSLTNNTRSETWKTNHSSSAVCRILLAISGPI